MTWMPVEWKMFTSVAYDEDNQIPGRALSGFPWC